MMNAAEIRADMKKEVKSFLDLYERGSIHWGALDRIKLLRRVLGQKQLTKAEKVYAGFSEQVAASYRAGAQARG